MKMNRLASFTLGVIVTAVSVGTVSFANAANDATIKTCANKKTGVMRYITKGKCKKTERTISWNQMGPQGLAGAPGAKGDTGAKGDSGATGQNLFAIDADGKSFGPLLAGNSTEATALIDNKIWRLEVNRNRVYGALGLYFYADMNCTVPYIHVDKEFVVSPQAVAIDEGAGQNNESAQAYVPSGQLLSFTDRDLHSFEWDKTLSKRVCQTVTTQTKTDYATDGQVLYSVTPVSKPAYKTPLTYTWK